MISIEVSHMFLKPNPEMIYTVHVHLIRVSCAYMKVYLQVVFVPPDAIYKCCLLILNLKLISMINIVTHVMHNTHTREPDIISDFSKGIYFIRQLQR